MLQAIKEQHGNVLHRVVGTLAWFTIFGDSTTFGIHRERYLIHNQNWTQVLLNALHTH